MNESERRVIASAVQAAMMSFEAAERALDADALIAHFAETPDFHVYLDAQRLSYQTMVSNFRTGFPKLHSIVGGFQGIHVIVLAPDSALATAAFREAITDAGGVTTRVRGAASWLWRRVDGDWRIVYGQAAHYPDS